jgi:hypothetical protein
MAAPKAGAAAQRHSCGWIWLPPHRIQPTLRLHRAALHRVSTKPRVPPLLRAWGRLCSEWEGQRRGAKGEGPSHRFPWPRSANVQEQRSTRDLGRPASRGAPPTPLCSRIREGALGRGDLLPACPCLSVAVGLGGQPVPWEWVGGGRLGG